MYKNIFKGHFVKRLNRLLALVDINGKIESVHIKNTSRCGEIFIPGAICYLEKSSNPNRKTKYTLISAEKNGILINLDSQIPNKIIFDAIVEGKILSSLKPADIKREVNYKSSRFDISFYSQSEDKKYFLEVKGVSLEENGIAAFPGAPTTRGKKHLDELVDAVSEGYGAIFVFLIQLENANLLVPNYNMDKDFSMALIRAKENNVLLKAYNSIVTKDSIKINKEVPISFEEKYRDNLRI
ncbi:DNA/RNA nuclease SfsA [Lagierella sp. ICN-221743]